MSKSVQEILALLDPHWDRIVRRPLTEDEVRALEDRVGLAVPPPLRDYLLNIGLFQDLTPGEDQSIEVFERPDEFADNYKSLCTILSSPSSRLFPFGHDGAGNVYALGDSSGDGWPIHFIDHETRKDSVQGEFLAWLEETVAQVLETIDQRTREGAKVWCVQFSFRGMSFEDLVKLLASVGTVRDIDGRWRNREGWPGQVRTAKRRIELDGRVFVVSRSAFYGWPSPSISFDMEEPVTCPSDESWIRKLDKLFSTKCPGYKLVDYGPLEVTPELEASWSPDLPNERWRDRSTANKVVFWLAVLILTASCLIALHFLVHLIPAPRPPSGAS